MILVLDKKQFDYLDKVLLNKEKEIRKKIEITKVENNIKLEFDEDINTLIQQVLNYRLMKFGFTYSNYIDDDVVTEEGEMIESIIDTYFGRGA